MKDFSLGSWDSFSFNLGCVLNGWRCNRGYSLEDLAVFENVDVSSIRDVELGVGSIALLLRYIDYIRCKEPAFLRYLFPAWVNMCGYSVNSL